MSRIINKELDRVFLLHGARKVMKKLCVAITMLQPVGFPSLNPMKFF
jgi:hypothetical protein